MYIHMYLIYLVPTPFECTYHVMRMKGAFAVYKVLNCLMNRRFSRLMTEVSTVLHL